MAFVTYILLIGLIMGFRETYAFPCVLLCPFVCLFVCCRVVVAVVVVVHSTAFSFVLGCVLWQPVCFLFLRAMYLSPNFCFLFSFFFFRKQTNRFHPEVLGITASSGLVVLSLEVIVVRLSFFALSVRSIDVADLVALCAYKYVGYVLCFFFSFCFLSVVCC